MSDGWYDESESGPPTMEDDAWYTHAVVSLGYPKVKRGDVPMDGQTALPCGSLLLTWDTEGIPSESICDLAAGHKGEHRMRSTGLA